MLFEKLAEKDIDTFMSYVGTFGLNPGASAYRSIASHEILLKEWAEAKDKHLYQLFGNQFILEREIEYAEPVDKIAAAIGESCGGQGKMREFYLRYMSLCNKFDWYTDEGRVLRHLINCHTLAKNAMNYCWTERWGENFEHITIDLGDGHKIKVDKETKPLRALGKIAKVLEAEALFEEFRLEHSRFLNNKKLKGTLCLSIHPMDYITMSDNASNWTSCMNWHEPGGYRSGTVEMMNSEMVVVGYLKSKDKVYQWGGDTWNDKHWRILLIASPEGIVSVKGYPYYHEKLTRTCVQWLSELGAKNLSWNFDKVAKVDEGSSFEYNGVWRAIESDTYNMYNDFGSTEHWGCFPKVEIENTRHDPIRTKFLYSGLTQCMCCGSTTKDFYDEGFVFCWDCSSEDRPMCNCDHCGCSYDQDDMYWLDDMCYCYDCIDEVAARCAIFDEYVHYEDLIRVYLARKDDAPDADDEEYIYIHRDFNGPLQMRDYARSYFNIDHPRFDNATCTYYLNRSDFCDNRSIANMLSWWTDSVDEYFNKS